MISLCVYNAHRTVVLSGPTVAAVVMNHGRNVGRLKQLPFPHLYVVIQMNGALVLINAIWVIKCCCEN